MSRINKCLSGAGLLAIGLCLVNVKPIKNRIHKLRLSNLKSRQLFNRLSEQIKATKTAMQNFKVTLKKTNLRPLYNHVNYFSKDIQPKLTHLSTRTKEKVFHNN